ncbi:MAG: hypothetical protein ACI3XI_07845 [Eubacteriales bacterium]
MKNRILLVLLALILCLSSCTGNHTDTADEADTSDPDATGTDQPAVTALEIIKNGECAYKVIRPETVSLAMIDSCVNLLKSVQNYTGVKITLDSDWYREGVKPLDPDALEILIGNTNRAETAEVLASLPENSYTVALKGNKLVIVGTDNNLTVMALSEFESRILKNEDKCSIGTLTVSEEDAFTVTLDAPVSVKDIIEGGFKFSCTSKSVVQTSKQGQYGVGQGSASDGTYVYFVLRNSSDTGSVITKHRLEDGVFVAVSEVLDLGHGNDMTYDSKNNRLVVAHGQSEGQILTLVNPDTLTVIKDITIPKGSGAITYNEKRDQYAISQGGKTLYILDSDFKLVSTFSRSDSTGYTAQGMGSDDDYIYFPMSGKSNNKLVVYKWSGEYVTTITVAVSLESESMFWVNGKYYIAYNTSGEALYETTFDMIYQ